MRKRVAWRRLFARPAPGWWKGPLWRAGAACAFILAWVLAVEPHALLNLPRLHFGLWLAFVLLYPALSVLPQELIYRVYLFEVHRKLLRRPLAAVTVSALAFAWLHIIFAGWLAPAACLLAGAALALNYQKNRRRPGAIWPLLLEHSLYGQLAFTLGLYQHFFIPR